MQANRSTLKALSLLLGGVCAVGIGEIGVRLFPTWHDAFVQDILHSRLPTDLYQPIGGFQPGEVPQKVRFRHHPNRQARFSGLEYDNWVYTDARGFRVSPEGRLKALGDRSILMLGDSFLFAGQVAWSQSVVGRLESAVSDIQWYNGGVDGYNTEDALSLWTEHRDLKPSEVWLWFFWGNDIWENDWQRRAPTQPSEDLEVSWEDRSRTLSLLRHSKLLSRIYALYAISQDERFAEKQAQMTQLRDSTLLGEALPSTQKALDAFSDQCQTESLRCRVFLIPPLEYFDDDALRPLPERLKSIVPASITVHDVAPVLSEKGGRSLYFDNDPHWNIHGHGVVAEWVQSTLD